VPTNTVLPDGHRPPDIHDSPSLHLGGTKSSPQSPALDRCQQTLVTLKVVDTISAPTVMQTL